MRTAYFLLLGLIGVSPVFLFVEAPLAPAVLVAFGAITMTLVVVFVAPGEMAHLANVIRPLGIAVVITGIWLVVQLVPLPKVLAHPIWSDAQAALGTTWLPGTITIDPGATVVAICRYFSIVAVVILAAAVAIQRERAGIILLWLIGAASIVAVLQMLDAIFLSRFPDAATDVRLRSSAPAVCALALLTALAASMGMVERRFEKSLNELRGHLIAIAPILAGAAICGISLLVVGRPPVLIAASVGVGAFLAVTTVRRLGLGAGTDNTIAWLAIVVLIVIAIVFADFHATASNAFLRYAVESSSLNSMTQRILSNAGWAGSGAGTFELLLPIYGEAGSVTRGFTAPTAAAKLTAELGAPAFWALLGMSLILLFLLVQGALERGRDWVYPALGAACIPMLAFEAFCDVSLFSTTVLLFSAIALGLGLSHRSSRVERRS
jgi:hypothetical protein